MAADLVEFVKARISEDEAAAKAVEPLGYTTDMGGTRLDERFSHARVRFAGEDGRSRIEPDVAAGRHFARHDPAQVLREVEAKRAIVEACLETLETEDSRDYITEGGTSEEYDLARYVVKQIAAAWSSHPDYRQQWKP